MKWVVHVEVDMDDHKRTIWVYYLYKMTTSYGFILPFSVIYIRQQGFGLGVIGVTQSAFLLSVVVMEMPAGYVADRLGRRPTLAIGSVLTAIALGSFPLIGSASGWITLYALWGVAWAFHSAIGDAWLYAFLDSRDLSAEFARTSGRASSSQLFMSAVAAAIAGGLYVLNPDFPFVANAGLAVIGIPLVLSLPGAQGEGSTTPSVREMLHVLHLQVQRPEIRWLVLYAALFNALFSVTRWLEQPSLEAVGVPIAGFGLLFASFKLVSAGAMLTTGWIQKVMGPQTFFLLLTPFAALAYSTLALVPALVVPVLYFRRVVASVSGPIRNQYFNDRIGDVGRATILSGVSMVLSLASGLTSVLFGQIAEATGPITFLSMVGPAIAVLAALLWITTSPVRTDTTHSAETPTGVAHSD
jgi:MFS family permease